MEDPKQIAIAVTIGIGTFLILTMIRRIVWSRLNQAAKLTKNRKDDLILKVITPPLRLLSLLISILIAAQYLPKSLSSDPVVSNVIRIGLIFWGTWLIDRFVSIPLKANLIFTNMSESSKTLFLSVFRVLLISLLAVAALDTLGISVTPILASLGVGSLAVALALQDTLTNFFSGIYLLIDRPVRVGDWINIDEGQGISGMIDHIGWRSTHIKQVTNNVVIIPNSQIVNARITNYDYPDKEFLIVIDCGVSYNSDLKQVERVSIEVAKEVLQDIRGEVDDADPLVRFKTFGASSIDFKVIIRVKNFEEQYIIHHKFIMKLHERFKKEGIEIPFPQRVLHLESQQTPISVELKNRLLQEKEEKREGFQAN